MGVRNAILPAFAALCAACVMNTAEQSIQVEAARQEKLWLEQGITRYEVTWLLLEGDDTAPDRHRSVRVLNGNVLDTRCPQERCPEAQLRDLRTIRDAFALIRENAARCDVKVLYHAVLHHPTWIRADCARSGLPDFRIVLRGFAAE